ncbi:vitamin K epoxide reductase family protein [Psychromarinibacter sp. C21-152]|uniref:Vitamin K epoxide reductase family protein n=1 Tax=Psychromarinibacter sediminicola TaxID=3033385 RepID=A0AAE3NZS7_9RHOB|nr:vitamin K epoxide reductase family protein [Psychromarinibacter sediminicola]MDF0603722.1 vitamin K epoxide reductase family protein [Psychromarinibacter sediminicola]
MPDTQDDIVLITGAEGRIGTRLRERLQRRYTVVGLDLPDNAGDGAIGCDLTDPDSVDRALERFARDHGRRIASVVHLAAYFDFSGRDSPLYDKVNVEGTRNLLRALQGFEVGQFVYSGTMLVHAPVRPGQLIDEDTPLAPGWAYPKSKAKTEQVIRDEAGDIPPLFLRLAGLYDDHTAVPTLSQQIARIYERSFESHVYAGDTSAGQALIHLDDMLDLFERAIDRRDALEPGLAILAGEPEVMNYAALQTRIAQLIHGEDDWQTVSLPDSIAKTGARLQVQAEPVVPDAYDEGETPFIKPFMIDMAEDHYALDISRARDRLGWEPQHRIAEGLEALVASLKADPGGWFRDNGITPPVWLRGVEDRPEEAEPLRARHERRYRAAHRRGLWAHWANAGLGVWVMTAPPLLGHDDPWMIASDVITGAAVVLFAFLSMSWRLPAARWVTAALGVWLMTAPLLFWSDNAAAYLNGTLVGMLVAGFAVGIRPPPGVSAAAAQSGPVVPKGWSYSPSDWFQRLPVIILAVVGLLISRYLAGYQLETIPGVWEPFFPGTKADMNGTEQIITSQVSEAWPVPDAGLGAMTYALEILVGAIGSASRWRTMPWLTVAFGIMIVPLGAVSIFFIVIQPIVIGTYCTLCLVAAAAMVCQIPFSVDEMVATYQFLKRRHAAGQPWLKVFFTGDTDEGPTRFPDEDFERSPREIVREMLVGGMTLPWTLAASAGVGVLLMLAPLLVTWDDPMAGTFHLTGALVITAAVTALAPVARLARMLNLLLGVALLFAPLLVGASWGVFALSVVAGLLLIGLSVPRGAVHDSYGDWDRYIR